MTDGLACRQRLALCGYGANGCVTHLLVAGPLRNAAALDRDVPDGADAVLAGGQLASASAILQGETTA